jgi:hypothetical protein
MPIHTDFFDMARGMNKTYKKGPVKCRDFTDGKSVCMSEEAWNVFFATGTKRYGEGFETKARPKNVQESFVDDIVDWYLREKRNGRI